MVNNVIGVVNYVIAARPSLRNFMIADNQPGQGLPRTGNLVRSVSTGIASAVMPPTLITSPPGALLCRHQAASSAVTLLSGGVAHVIDQVLVWFCFTGWRPWLSW